MKKGFTLIELLIVITIIGILAVAFLPSLLDAPAKSRDAQRLATVQKIESFLVSENLSSGLPAASACIDSAGAAGTIGKLISDNVADFGGVFPTDPDSGNYIFGTTCGGQYMYVKFGSTQPYEAAVVAKVEVATNGNTACPTSLTSFDAAPPTLADTGACYVVMFQ